MRLSTRKLQALVGLTLLVGTLGTAVMPPPRSTLAGAHREALTWVEARGDNLPRTFDSIARLPLLVRRAVLQSLPVADRDRIWLDQFRTFVLPANQLSAVQQQMVADLGFALADSQKTMIQSVIDQISSGTVPDSTAEQRSRNSRSFCLAASKVFKRDAVNRIFVHLGPTDSTFIRLVSDKPAQATMLALQLGSVIRYGAIKAGILPRSMADPCICFMNLGVCEGCADNKVCTQTWPPCDAPIINNCGCRGDSPCDGGQCI